MYNKDVYGIKDQSFESEYWKTTKSDVHHCTWKHMMWRAKDGQYVCLNIDMIYNKKEKTVTTLFYWVNGDGSS